MMSPNQEPPSPFDHRPDAVLGAALRRLLTARDDAGFAERVLAAAAIEWGGASADWVEVLTRWARPGLAAAALALAAGSGLWLATRSGGTNGYDAGDPLRVADEQLAVPAFLASTGDPDVDAVLAVALGN